MKTIRKLTWEELKHSCLPSNFSFKTTNELNYLDGVIGQERAKKAMNFGLSVTVQGYNIYILGEPGTGKTTFAKVYSKEIAKKKRIPNDWCYVYNFKQSRYPKALCFEPGDGKQFKEDMEELIEYLINEIPNMYSSKKFEEERNNIIDEYQVKKEVSINKLKDHAKCMGFLVQILKKGISLTPLTDDDKPMSEQEFELLEVDEREKIEQQSKDLQEISTETIKYIEEIERKFAQEIEDLEYDTGLKGIAYYIKGLKEKYEGYGKVKEYLNDLQQDILEHIHIFVNEKEEGKETAISVLPWMGEVNVRDLVKRYGVNLLIDHSESSCAPVIEEFNCTYGKIIGEIEYENEFGSLSTNFMKIKPGLFHKANGGYLILQAEDVLSNQDVWKVIKQVLRTNKIQIEPPSSISAMTLATLKPESIPIDIKVLLIGNSKLYNLLYNYDADFRKLFKVRADFDIEMGYDEQNANLMARFIKTYCDKEFLLPFSPNAVNKVIEYASRYVGNKTKITTEFNIITSIIVEASTYAENEAQDIVNEKYVEKAINEKEYRYKYYEEKLDERIKDGKIMIETQGQKVGQINALAVYDLGEYRFGKPLKITATTYRGQSGIINIEKEAKLSGAIHTKGTNVIAGYLGQTFAQVYPLSLSSRICFEQNYNSIDGDSASSAELYAVLSSLADIPIRQNIAVTGSVNQHGEIQPIGGATHKIEGFYKLCKNRGLSGTQGVVIPESNISDIVLKDEIIAAVRENKFHIYAINTIEEGMEIVTGVPYEEVKNAVNHKLNQFYMESKRRAKKDM